jgi:alpha-L-fucosidase
LFALLCFHISYAQQRVSSPPVKYEWPTDPLVKEKLERWQDQKFGIIIHWGLYSVPGIIESWALCSEGWIERDSTIPYEDFKRWYWGLKKEFNPVNFNPEQWATIAKEAGMKYLVFTTKHHDGFCMFDTKETDFKITDGPFKNHPKADVTKFVFEAFRKQDFLVGAYFSKPDWHSPWYWWPKYATADRNNNYDIRKYPARWEQFKQYSFNQLSELMQHYGPVDILWLDGGWVRPLETVNEEVLSWGARVPEWSQDIDIPRVAAMARKAQPGLLMVDRTVHGPYENYRTPEQKIPEQKLDYPWESCISLANNWGYVPGDHYKSSGIIIHSLVEIVAKGGNLLLGIGPKPGGTFPEEAIVKMKEVGHWLNINGPAIYGTRPVKNYVDGNTYFTHSKNLGLNYALILLQEQQPMPVVIQWKGNPPKKGSKMIWLQNGKPVKWKQEGETTRVFLSKARDDKHGNLPAIVLSFLPS